MAKMELGKNSDHKVDCGSYEYEILQATEDLNKKEKSAFLTYPLTMKNNVQDKTGVAIPDDLNVDKMREFCQENKK